MFFRAVLFLTFVVLFSVGAAASTDPLAVAAAENEKKALIIDHNCTDISRIPEAYIKKAKKNLSISLSRAPKDIQISAGLENLMKLNQLYGFSDDSTFYKTGDVNFKRPAGTLSLWDKTPEGNLGLPNRSSWVDKTEAFLKGSGSSRDVVIWTWGEYASNAGEKDIYSYLEEMDDLEAKFPGVRFVYMTGPLDGSGKDGRLNKNNETIRKFCRENSKILFDFADIESYDPDGRVNYMELNGDDNCNYVLDGKKSNWADQWLERNPGNSMLLPVGQCGTKPLNAALKSRAFWWMLACLSGWDPPPGRGRHHPPFSLGLSDDPASIPEAPPGLERPLAVKHSKFLRGYNFKKLRDYRDWIELGTFESIIPKRGEGLSIPQTGQLVLGVNRRILNVRELRFNAKIRSGKSLNWYINFEWDSSWKPLKGIGGIIDENGCKITIDGELIKIPNSPKSDYKEHEHTISIKKNRLTWAIDGKKIIGTRISEKALSRKGMIGVGGLNSKVHISRIFLKE